MTEDLNRKTICLRLLIANGRARGRVDDGHHAQMIDVRLAPTLDERGNKVVNNDIAFEWALKTSLELVTGGRISPRTEEIDIFDHHDSRDEQSRDCHRVLVEHGAYVEVDCSINALEATIDAGSSWSYFVWIRRGGGAWTRTVDAYQSLIFALRDWSKQHGGLEGSC